MAGGKDRWQNETLTVNKCVWKVTAISVGHLNIIAGAFKSVIEFHFPLLVQWNFWSGFETARKNIPGHSKLVTSARKSDRKAS